MRGALSLIRAGSDFFWPDDGTLARGYDRSMDAITSEIERLQDRITQLQELRSSPHATPELLKCLEETFGEHGLRWLFEPSAALGCRPVDWVLTGRTREVMEFVEMIGYGTYA